MGKSRDRCTTKDCKFYECRTSVQQLSLFDGDFKQKWMNSAGKLLTTRFTDRQFYNSDFHNAMEKVMSPASPKWYGEFFSAKVKKLGFRMVKIDGNPISRVAPRILNHDANCRREYAWKYTEK
jgi:hypothetical protein